MMTRVSVTVTVNASGDGTGYTDHVSGVVRAISYVKNNYADGIDVTVTTDVTGQTVLAWTNVNASATTYPYTAMKTTADAAALYAAGGVAVLAPIPVAAERLKFVVAQGGNATSGTFYAYIES
jgi:hypothetical protein